jgi:hypothetical protein
LDVVVGLGLIALSLFILAAVPPGMRALSLPLALGVLAGGLANIAAAIPTQVRLPRGLVPLTLVGWLALVLTIVATAPGGDAMEIVSVAATFAAVTGFIKLLA